MSRQGGFRNRISSFGAWLEFSTFNLDNAGLEPPNVLFTATLSAASLLETCCMTSLVTRRPLHRLRYPPHRSIGTLRRDVPFANDGNFYCISVCEYARKSPDRSCWKSVLSELTEHLAHRVWLPSDSQTLSSVDSAQQGCGHVLCNDHIDQTLGTSISGEGEWIDRHPDLHFKTPRFWGGFGRNEIVHLSGSEFPQDSEQWRRSDSDSLLPGLSRARRTEGFLSQQRQ